MSRHSRGAKSVKSPWLRVTLEAELRYSMQWRYACWRFQPSLPEFSLKGNPLKKTSVTAENSWYTTRGKPCSPRTTTRYILPMFPGWAISLESIEYSLTLRYAMYILARNRNRISHSSCLVGGLRHLSNWLMVRMV